jgi:hypothetical protein
MDDTVIFENHPSVKNPVASWQWCIYPFPEVITVLPGQTVLVTAVRNRNTPWFFFKGVQ